MNDLESQLATARELIDLAERRGIDLRPACHDWAFLNDGRFILVWRKGDRVHYNMQGSIRTLPERYKASAGAFRGMWTEAGTLPNLDDAFEFLKAWLIDKKEVEELPRRYVRREGIG